MKARLVLISKGKGPVGAVSSYRPICMLESAGKLLENLLRPMLHAAMKAARDLAGRQYGFRSGLSTIHEVQEVVTAAKMTGRGNHRTRPLCLLATLDVKNAFNSVRGDLAKETLELPESTFLVGYADDFAVVITARDTEGAQLLLNQVMRRVTSWMEDHGLSLAAQKTQIVILTRKRINTLRRFPEGQAAVQTKMADKYLGFMLDNKLNYGEHIIMAADTAAKVVASMGILMAKIKGPRPCMRRLLMHAAEAVMLYGAKVCAEPLQKEEYRKRITAVQKRGNLRIACSYRMVSESAVLVVAGVFPIDLLSQERKFVHQQRCVLGMEKASRLARSISIKCWQSRWEQERRGRWTDLLNSQLDNWINRESGEVDFYLTQFLIGHGLFRSYMARMRKSAERLALEQDLGDLSPDNVVEKMLRGQKEWNKVAWMDMSLVRSAYSNGETDTSGTCMVTHMGKGPTGGQGLWGRA
ncbi:uncharacterized protein LOC118450545 [Vespa mandarinia]|uniref:uncharacterized protein LOC118450545 n=1 Tax=Vespa mandarinia TaxID=7446 RepID=UPI001613C5FE|nr:uncharacterized protein LOC118450545 [Vespa mandarinia]